MGSALPGIIQQEHKGDYSLLNSAKVKKRGSNKSTPSPCPHCTHKDNFVFFWVRWRSKVNLRYWLLYPHENMPQHLVDRSLGKPQSRSGYYEGKNLISAENQTPIPQSLNLHTSPYTDCAIPAPFRAPCI